ncbi:HNH endonuclease [Synechococcus phage ACG-2014f]|uniref:Putative HNH endonuclease n=1 Tax=Synechococcus phage ACG-2014f TaxID=1493511 RepID=A0A0E3F7X2_9CAUD|nr:HNH endonuclease [Synechococcus phage ACG-2014f]AIX21709.1 putative HNH endonuclease [Synechococcus phage ACG-2014f]
MPKTTHGMYGTLTYNSWVSMKSRCKTQECYKGVTICESWQTFEGFYSDMGVRPSKQHTLDRIDNSKGYTPSNVRWATKKEQIDNRTIAVTLTIDGVTKPLQDWCDEYNLNYWTCWSRLKQYNYTDRQVLGL